MKYTVEETLDIMENCIPIEGGFVHPDTAEFFSDEDLIKIISEHKEHIDRVGMSVLEGDKREESKKALSKHYAEQADLEHKRNERKRFYLGYATQGKKMVCEHVSVLFYGKQERLALRCKDSAVPDEFKKDRITRVPDTTLIRAELEKGNAKVAEFAYIDLRKKATVK